MQDVGKHSDAFSFEVKLVGICVVQINGLGQVHCAVQDCLSLFTDTLLTSSDFVVKVAGNGHFGDLRDCVRSDSPGLDSHHPVVDVQLATLFLKQLLKVERLSVVSVEPPFVLDTDDLIEGFVLSKLAVDSLQINLVGLEYFKESFKANHIEPSVFLQGEEDTTQDVADIAAAAHVGGQRSV